MLEQDEMEGMCCGVLLVWYQEAGIWKSSGSSLWLLAWSPGELVSDSTAGKDSVLKNQVSKEAQLEETGSKHDKSPHAENSQGSAGMAMKHNEGRA